jgi:voltage-gated potassium channel
MELREIARRFWLPMAMLAAVVAYGVLGYTAIVARASPLDALYWTVLTLGGVGFRDTERSGAVAELFSISLIVALLAAVVVAVAIASELVGSGDLTRTLRRRRMRKRIAALRDHFILCGYGRVGRAVAEEYRIRDVPLIVIEVDARSAEELEERGVPHLIADPQHDGVLEEAGIHVARGLVCAVDCDAVNAFIALSARTLNPRLTIVARASDPSSVAKLTRVGADRVVSPYTRSGQRMALDSLAVEGAVALEGA